MDIVVIHALNALLYASVLFLIAGGLSLIYGVMRIVNLAHGNLYAFGAYVSAWVVGLLVARRCQEQGIDEVDDQDVHHSATRYGITFTSGFTRLPFSASATNTR